MPEINQSALAVRRRLRDDFAFYAPNALQIRTKDQKIEPFRLNVAQERLLEVIERQLETRGYVRIIILKGRQMGLSTAVGGWIYWWVSQRIAQKAIVVTHDSKATRNLFSMTERFHEKCPDLLRPHTKYSSRTELLFDKLDSGYTVATAGGAGIGRSDTITCAHLSELAFWERSTARDNYSGLMECIPTRPGTAVFIESTANGVSGLFYEQWQAAIQGTTDFEPLFLPWFIDEGYRLPVPKDFQRTPEEEGLAAEYGLDDGQLMFRRAKVAEKGVDQFRQEYPCCATEAFLTSGRPVFNPDQINAWIDAQRASIGFKDPLARMSLEGKDWIADPRGELACYAPHRDDETYTIGADTGAGVRRDFSVATVQDSSRRVVAKWRSDRYDPDNFARILAHLGAFYNYAEIIPENNNHGILVCRVLNVDFSYPNLYRQEVYDKISDTTTMVLGFNTNVKSKPMIIDKLRADLRTGDVPQIEDVDTLHELRAFVVTENGRMEGDAGTHDDCVMALALANHANKGAWVPIVNESSWYGAYDAEPVEQSAQE